MKSVGRIPSLGRVEKLSSLQKDYPPNYKSIDSIKLHGMHRGSLHDLTKMYA